MIRRRRTIQVLAAITLASSLLLASCSTPEPGAPDSGDEVTAPTAEADPPAPGGAMIDNDQRSWPDVTGGFDDTPHATPGTYSVDSYWQRPVWTPDNHDGDLPERSSFVESMDSCSSPGGVVLEDKTQQQYVNARFLVVNEQAGPTTMTKGVPGGYAKSPQGAVVAAMNQTGYGLPAQGDEIGEEIDRALWSSSKRVAEDRDFFKLPLDEEGMAYSRPTTVAAAHGYRLVTCSPRVMVVEVLYKAAEQGAGIPAEHTVARVPLIWTDGDWKADFSGSADEQQARTTASEEGFTQVSYQ
ncbi:hypothetical protein CATRI_13530 (plasmid) [Corynebacterium atrinae]|uniref:hypothetical protein n=2 Tax=Actinomycetes TaxID=1760 RepID=UPI0025B3AF5E|nr:hypothetical protein [Corynebacterium atrinae]WJY64750.1 hypothetical protein CATRI_13530 [Corynebacterium atrinae]